MRGNLHNIQLKTVQVVITSILFFTFGVFGHGSVQAVTLPANSYGSVPQYAVLATTKKMIPRGASALCRDGTYSFSHTHRGTCSHHKGVAKWY